MKIRLTKDDVLSELRAKLPEIKAFDKEQLVAHRDRKEDIARRRRIYLLRLAKLGDDKLSEIQYIGSAFGDDEPDWPSRASCPIAAATLLEQNIKWIEADNRKTYTIDMTDRSGIPAWLNWVHPDHKPDATVCA